MKKLYKAIVRPKLEYCSCIRDPYQQKYVEQLEMVQHRAARFVKSVPHQRTKPPTSVSAMVSDFGWEPLQTRRLHGRLNMFYKITRSMVELPPEYHPVPQHQPAARGHSQQFQCLQPSCLQVRLLSKNNPGLECFPSGASGGRVTGGDQAAYAVTPVTSSRVHTAGTVFLHLFLFEVHLCTASTLQLLPPLFTRVRPIRRSEIGTHQKIGESDMSTVRFRFACGRHVACQIN